jgi:hypothetical protein
VAAVHSIRHLEALLLRELQAAWERLAWTHFRGSLRAPVFALSDSVARLGSWYRASRTLELSRALVAQHAWPVVLEVLKHELAHQYVDEVLRAHDEPAHGPAFQAVCARLGIDPAATGVPRAPEAVPSPEAKILERVQRLLALADSPNPHEAQAAMNAAHRLMLKHNLGDAPGGGPRYAYRHLGAPTARLDASERMLAGILANHFFVRAIWVPVYVVAERRRGKILEVCGTSVNLDMAEYVHAYLRETGARCWKEFKHRNGIKADRERRRYLVGLMTGFHEKLAAQTRLCREEGLVWAGDPGLEDYTAARYPSLRTTRSRVVASAVYHRGREDGRNIILRKPVSSAPTSRGRALGGPTGDLGS